MSLCFYQTASLFSIWLPQGTKDCGYILNDTADSFIQLVSLSFLIFFSLWWIGFSCSTPSFHFAQQPLHQFTFILSIHSLTFSFCPLGTPARTAMTDRGGTKKEKVEDEDEDEEGSGRKQCCRQTYSWSQSNPQTSHHGALIQALPGADRQRRDLKNVIKETNWKKVEILGWSWQTNPRDHNKELAAL